MISFRGFLQLSEFPIVDYDSGFDGFSSVYGDMKTMQNHHDATHLGDNYYANGDSDSSEFYHLDSFGKIDAISRIDDGEQIMLRKAKGVDSSIPLNIFRHALNYHGKIISDATHTPGSKRFWQSLPNHFPDAKFHVINTDLDKSLQISPEDLVKKEDKIWGNQKYGIRLAIEK